MITYIGTQKAFNKFQHDFVIKALELLELMSQRTCLKTKN